MCVDQHSVFFLFLIDFGFGNVLLRSLYWELRDIEVLARILFVKLWMIHLKLCRSQFSFNLLNRRGCVTVVVLLHGRLFYHFGAFTASGDTFSQLERVIWYLMSRGQGWG